MPITKESDWDNWVKKNNDPYGKACVDVARRVMEILDKEPGDFDVHALVTRGDEETDSGGITGFMAGCVASMVSHCHSRGEEFRKKWNHDVAPDQEDTGGVLNPALLTIGAPSE
jgi:hypothetical protein